MRTIEETVTVSANDRRLLQQLKEAVQALLPEATAVLYGSVARGTHGPESDYDLLVLVDAPISVSDQRRVRRAIFQLELAWDVVFSIIFYTKDEWNTSPLLGSPFRLRVEQDAIIL